jgi:hypothetical protein
MAPSLVAAFIAVVGVLVFFWRRELARMQALVLGGSVVPGCVVAEAVALLVAAAALVICHRYGLV